MGTHLVQQLLEKGYTVHATVRSLVETEGKYEHLKQLAAALPGSLKLFKADLLTEGSFDKAVAGCKVVFHTAYATSSPATELTNGSALATVSWPRHMHSRA